MKTIKLTIVALILACSFQAAHAQLRVGVRIGTPPPPPREVIVERQHGYYHSGYRRGYRRPVYVHHAYYRREDHDRRRHD